MNPEQVLRTVPVKRAGRKKLRQPTILPGLAPVTIPAQPAQVVQGERTKHRRWAQRTGYLYRQPMVHLVGRAAGSHPDADLTPLDKR